MVVTGLGLLLGGAGRRRPRSAPASAAAAWSRAGSRLEPAAPRWRRRPPRPGASSTTARCCCWPARSRPRAGPGRSSAARRCRSVVLGELAELAGRRARPVRPACGCCARAGSARRWTGSPAPALAAALRAATARACAGRLRELEARAATSVVAQARERAQEADLLRFGLAEIEAVAPAAGRGRRAARPRRTGWPTPTRCAPRPRTAHGALAGDAESSEAGPDALAAARRGPRSRSTRSAATTPSSAALADRLAEAGYLRRRRRRRRAPPTPPRSRPTRPGWPRSSERRAALTGADPQVRRRPSTTCSPGPSRPRPAAARAGRRRRPDRRAAAERRAACARELAGPRRALVRAPAAAAAERLADGGHRRAAASWPCRTPGSTSQVRQRRPDAERAAVELGAGPRALAAGPDGVDEVELLLAAAPRAPRRGRWPRAPPAVSCPG